MKFNKNKCQFHKDSIVFLGPITSSEGIRVDPSKIDKIPKMPVPQSLTGFQRLAAMLNYLGNINVISFYLLLVSFRYFRLKLRFSWTFFHVSWSNRLSLKPSTISTALFELFVLEETTVRKF